MSCYEWERGTLTLSTAEYRRVKKSLIEAYNKAMEADFLTLNKLYEALCAAGKGKRGFDWRQGLINLMEEKVTQQVRSLMGYYHSQTVPKHSFSDIRYFDAHDLLLLREEKDETGKVKSRAYGSPMKPKKKDFAPMAASAKNPHFTAGDGSISLDDAKRTLLWSVSENNHAIEHSRDSYTGKALFKLLESVKWTRGTGGFFVTNNEYNTENRDAGGGANLLGDTFGPLGEKEKDHRNKLLFAGLRGARSAVRKRGATKSTT